jgi:hypothetical protein
MVAVFNARLSFTATYELSIFVSLIWIRIRNSLGTQRPITEIQNPTKAFFTAIPVLVAALRVRDVYPGSRDPNFSISVLGQI